MSTPIPPGVPDELARWLDELEHKGTRDGRELGDIERRVIETGRHLIRLVRGEPDPESFGGPSTEDDHLAEET